MTLPITILMICYTLIALFLGGYFFAHRQKPFLVFHPEHNHGLATVVMLGGLALILIGLLAAVATILARTVLVATSLLLGVLVIIVLQIFLVHWYPKG